ncbi:MAG TPA: peptide-methionine (S)-S-oxide reductase MsrA [Rhodocyclaceae bacterium]|jgi:peptide-methionine (S)-S-oxide reductase|nr:peptide-methionine (S)-S-oxide reductase MsrA [Rhodocyclaceae bacterium]
MKPQPQSQDKIQTQTQTRTRRVRVRGGLLAAIVLFAVSGFAAAQSGDAGRLATATFAGGCFWCMEPPYDELEGVISTTSGYTDGQTENPTYKEVSSGKTGHTEAVQVVYDPEKVSFERLVEVFWRNIDPTDAGGQFCDRGSPYRPALFYHDEAQRAVAERSLAELEANKPFKEPIVTPLVAASTFYPAEEYHQDYYLKNPIRYKYYRNGCGRDRRLKELWDAS